MLPFSYQVSTALVYNTSTRSVTCAAIFLQHFCSSGLGETLSVTFCCLLDKLMATVCLRHIQQTITQYASSDMPVCSGWGGGGGGPDSGLLIACYFYTGEVMLLKSCVLWLSPSALCHIMKALNRLECLRSNFCFLFPLQVIVYWVFFTFLFLLIIFEILPVHEAQLKCNYSSIYLFQIPLPPEQLEFFVRETHLQHTLLEYNAYGTLPCPLEKSLGTGITF